MEEIAEITSRAVRETLKQGSWALPLLFPPFRESLLTALRDSHPSSSFGNSPIAKYNLPTALLSCAYYLSKKIPERNRQPVTIGPFHTEVIGRAQNEEDSFWSEAVKTVVDEKAELASLTEADLFALERALDSFKDPSYRALFQWITPLVIFENPDWLASSQPHYAGAVFLNKNLLHSEALTETFIHELAHQELFCLNLIDRLVQPHADEKFQFAPFQKMERPTLGRLHAAHSLYRTCQFHATQLNDGYHSEQYDKAWRVLQETGKTLSSGDLTPFGNFLVQNCYFSLANKANESLFFVGGNR